MLDCTPEAARSTPSNLAANRTPSKRPRFVWGNDGPFPDDLEECRRQMWQNRLAGFVDMGLSVQVDRLHLARRVARYRESIGDPTALMPWDWAG